jgi:O-methyltransferase
MNETNKDLYLNLLKHTLTYYLWGETFESLEQAPPKAFLRRLLYSILNSTLKFATKGRIGIGRHYRFNPDDRLEGKDWPPLADTMIGLKRLDNIQFCIEDILRNSVPGDLIETGVWRGGAVIFMRAVLKAHGVTDRVVWAADSFEGLPHPSDSNYPQDAGDPHHTFTDYLGVSLEQVQRNFRRYDLLDEQVQFLKGWFKDTLPTAPIQKLSLLRMDGDMYSSTMDALKNLYPRLSVGGYVIVDDYHIAGCRQAIHDYRDQLGITEEIQKIDWAGVFWKKSK